ncbi:MAG: cation:proton antiporter [Planctomycetota bacterium]|nr:cation:proton antiporter [Planctomycetota bacterium]
MHGPLVALTILTLGAALIVWALQRWRLSPVLGYLTMGVLVGPFQASFFGEGKHVHEFADIGVILLMFFIGLEFHLGELRAMLKICLGGGSMQVALAALAGGLCAWAFGVPPMAAGIVGLMIAFSSTALVMRSFEDRREGDRHLARTAVAVLLFQDLAAILVVAVLPVLKSFNGPAGSTVDWRPIVTQVGLLVVALPVLFFGARYVLPKLFERTALARQPEAFSLLSLGACMLVALAAQMAGASTALGAFLGGLVLSHTPFASQILADLSTLRNLSMAFFFVTVGMLADVSYVAANALPLAGALAGLVLLKTLLTAAATAVWRVPLGVSLGVALALAQIGEFSFVLGREAQLAGFLSDASLRFVLALAVLSMLATPFLIGLSDRLVAWAGRRPQAAPASVPDAKAPAAEGEAAAEAEAARPLRAVVVGYGPVGRTLTRILTDFGIQPVVIDLNLETVRKLNGMGIRALFGDSGRREILEAAGIKDAAYLLITLPDLAGRMPVVATARLMNPSLKILTRARYLAERSMLEDAGASGVSYEEAEVAVGLAEMLLREVGGNAEDIQKEARRIRAEIALRTGFTMMLPAPVRPKPLGGPPAPGNETATP